MDIREWRDDRPSKKGISLTLMRYKNLVYLLELADRAIQSKESFDRHLGGNVYITIGQDSACVDIRQYWNPQGEVVPTKKGICLRPTEYSRLKELLPEIGGTLPELDGVVPCFLQGDHQNQLGALMCSECSPNF